MKINWEVRFRNKNFWIAAVPMVLLLAQAVLKLFGLDWQPDVLSDKLLDIINTLFAFLTIIGVVNDPTTAGVGDSAQARTYHSPKGDE